MRRFRSDPRFEAAVRNVLPETEGPFFTSADSSMIEKEIATLVDHGFSETAARNRFREVLRVECTQRDRSLRDQLIQASEAAESGDQVKCLAKIEQILSGLNTQHGQNVPVLECLVELARDEFSPGSRNWRELWLTLDRREVSP